LPAWNTADDAGHRGRVTDVDGVDRAMGHRRSDEREVQHSRLDEVVDVLALPSEQRRILDPQHRVPQNRA
jgi:hypothetical protein